MIDAATRYRALFTDLLIQRELAGGSLSDDIEAAFVAELDRYWWAMTPAQQEAFEATASNTLEAPQDLRSQDVRLEKGNRLMPRKAA